jgi:DNA-directed RNA polymerase subunit RPC12/RpoP
MTNSDIRQFAYGRCIECEEQVDFPNLVDNIGANNAAPGVCPHCGHIVLVASFDSEGWTTQATYNDLHEPNNEEFRNMLHEAQEKVHHDKGHWG